MGLLTSRLKTLPIFITYEEPPRDASRNRRVRSTSPTTQPPWTSRLPAAGFPSPTSSSSPLTSSPSSSSPLHQPLLLLPSKPLPSHSPLRHPNPPFPQNSWPSPPPRPSPSATTTTSTLPPSTRPSASPAPSSPPTLPPSYRTPSTAPAPTTSHSPRSSSSGAASPSPDAAAAPPPLPTRLPPSPSPSPSGPSPPDNSVHWSAYSCKSFACLVDRKHSTSFDDCKDCFDLDGREKHRWITPSTNPLDFTIDEVLAAASPRGSIRMGLDIGGGSGTFAVRMLERNVTIVATSMNLNGPFNSFMAARGVVPLYISISQRLPFFDNTLDIVHSMHVLSNWIPTTLLHFIMFDVYRVLRPGGLFWLDHFFFVEEQMGE